MTEGQPLQHEADWFVQARNLVAVRRYALAEELTRRELARNPRSAVALTVLSMVLSEQKRYAEAEAAARSAIAVRPLYGEAYYLLAVGLINQKRATEAGAAIDTALELDPSDPKFYALRSQLELAWDFPAQARATAEAGLRWNPKHPDCLYQLLRALRRLDDNARAETTARTIIGLNPGYWRAHLALGELLLLREAYLPAEEHFRTALRLEPSSQDAKNGLSITWKQRYWLPRQMEKLDTPLIKTGEWLEARLGKAGYPLLFIGLVLVCSLLCLPLGLLYGWAYLRWRLAPVVLQLRGRPLAWLGPLNWRLAVAGVGCLGALVLAVLLPTQLPVVAATMAGLAAVGVWREVWGEPVPEPDRRHVEWFWVVGAVAVVFLFWLDDTPPAFRARLTLFGYAAALSIMTFTQPQVSE
ncbi:tetratricopeptide repeat protein [Hymenobacter convexus]|uniref:tetratricopeptide repeat protein n=1 Tax=Hymenobacter sp. CA1UV-4 TaxID=3063782 RepID=UPI002713B8FC|nr:tetratricopeptide repeat protein [Hymenobacter sp. CA1UV-4]MDO7853257.1 tetratricopeptide repeat protein [Hymenobacter sp. CA1UV-4]